MRLLPLLLFISLLSAFSLSSLSAPATAPAAPAAPAARAGRTATSRHLLLFAGAHWAAVAASSAPALRDALVADVRAQVDRKYSFDTAVAVEEVRPSGLVNVTVRQTVFANARDAHLRHVWPPDEVNSMIAQGKFAKTKGLYVGSDQLTLLAVQMPEMTMGISQCTATCKMVFIVALCVLALMCVTFLIVLLWIIYVQCCMRSSSRDSASSRTPNAGDSKHGEPYKDGEKA